MNDDLSPEMMEAETLRANKEIADVRAGSISLSSTKSVNNGFVPFG